MRHFLFFLVFSLTAAAQTFDKERLDAYFDGLSQHDRWMGSVALSKGGEIVYSRAIGYSDIESGIKATAPTRYRIGSVSKTFTAVLVMKAVEAKKLTLTATLDKWFPQVPNAAKITIDDLLSHRSGIHNFTDDAAYLTYYTAPKTRAELLAVITQAGSDFAPGSKAGYSNSNYVLLSYILEDIHKKPFRRILDEELLQPLQLTGTSYGGPINSATDAHSYGFDTAWKKESPTDMSIPMGAGAIISTAEDLVKFSDALFNGRVLLAASLVKMKEMRDQYGRGLFPMPYGPREGFGHTGGIDGFGSMFAHFDDGDVSIALISNGSRFENNKIGRAMLDAIYGNPFEIPSFQAVTLAAGILESYKGEYSSATIPIKLSIRHNGRNLLAQASGQSEFELETVDEKTFRFDMVGLELYFPAPGKMILKQRGGEWEFTKN